MWFWRSCLGKVRQLIECDRAHANESLTAAIPVHYSPSRATVGTPKLDAMVPFQWATNLSFAVPAFIELSLPTASEPEPQ